MRRGGLQAIFDGVLHFWLLRDGQSFDLEAEGMLAVALYLKGLGFDLQKEIA